MYNHYHKLDAEFVNVALLGLPKAQIQNLFTVPDDEAHIGVDKVSPFKVIKVTDPATRKSEYVYTPTKRYHLVQHWDAFRPIVEGLTLSGTHDFKFVLDYNMKKANFQVFVGGQGYDTVDIGFSVSNSFDGKSLRFGYEMKHTGEPYIELVGYREVCSNGMKVRVPLSEAEIIKPEIAVKVKQLLHGSGKINHTKHIKEKIQTMQHVIEAMALLREPAELMFKKAHGQLVTEDRLNELVKLHVGKRFKRKVLEHYEDEEPTLWGLYNALTATASHDAGLGDAARENLLNKAANMLMVEVKTS